MTSILVIIACWMVLGWLTIVMLLKTGLIDVWLLPKFGLDPDKHDILVGVLNNVFWPYAVYKARTFL